MSVAQVQDTFFVSSRTVDIVTRDGVVCPPLVAHTPANDSISCLPAFEGIFNVEDLTTDGGHLLFVISSNQWNPPGYTVSVRRGGVLVALASFLVVASLWCDTAAKLRLLAPVAIGWPMLCVALVVFQRVLRHVFPALARHFQTNFVVYNVTARTFITLAALGNASVAYDSNGGFDFSNGKANTAPAVGEPESGEGSTFVACIIFPTEFNLSPSPFL